MVKKLRSYCSRLEISFFRLIRQDSGVSAIEFALVAPVFAFGLVLMADVGFATYQRLAVDHILRAGAQSAMADPGTDSVRAVLNLTAAQNFPSNSTTAGSPPPLTLAVDRYCSCPDAPSVKVSCSTICPGPTTARTYYTLSASTVHAGMLVPQFAFNPQIQVQVR